MHNPLLIKLFQQDEKLRVKGIQAMSRSLDKSASELERKAQNKAEIIRKIVREYNESIGSDSEPGYALRSKKERKIEKAVAEYEQVHKALKRLRKKMSVAK